MCGPLVRSGNGELSYHSSIFHTKAERCDSVLMVYITEHLVDRKPDLEALFGIIVKDTIIIRIAPSKSAFRALTHGLVPDWGMGVAVPSQNSIVLCADSETRDRAVVQPIEKIATHEFTHIVLGRITGLPLWFHEGCAMLAAGEFTSTKVLGRSQITGQGMSLDSIDSLLQFDPIKAQLAYEQSHSALRFFIEEYGLSSLRMLLAQCAAGVTFEEAFQRATGITTNEFQQQWHTRLRSKLWIVWADTLDEFLWYFLIPALVVVVWMVIKIRNRITLAKWKKEGLDGEPDDDPVGQRQ